MNGERERFSRTEMLIGPEAMETLANARVAIFGVGGVGGFAAEALCRSGIGSFTLVDHDTVSASNINRQIIALTSTVGREKTEVMAARMAEINPDVSVTLRSEFFLPENAHTFDFSSFDYVVDAVDTVSAKIAVIECAKRAGVRVISAMGAGNKLDPSKFRVADIEKTSVCPLARVMRRELRARGIKNVKVVYSEETPVERRGEDAYREALSENPNKRSVPGSISYAPAVMGLLIASEVIKDLIREGKE